MESQAKYTAINPKRSKVLETLMKMKRKKSRNPSYYVYGSMTEDQAAAVIQNFKHARGIGATDPVYASAIAARAVLVKTDKQWNSTRGAEAWAAALALLVHRGYIKTDWTNKNPTRRIVPLSKKLNNGELVLARMDKKYGLVAVAYANRTQAKRAEADLREQGFSVDVTHRGVPFYVRFNKANPGAAWHADKADFFAREGKRFEHQGKHLAAGQYYTMGLAHRMSADASRKMGMNPAQYRHFVVEPLSHFNKDSLRTITRGFNHRVIIGCPKGYKLDASGHGCNRMKGNRTRGPDVVGTRAHSVLHPKGENPRSCKMKNPSAAWHDAEFMKSRKQLEKDYRTKKFTTAAFHQGEMAAHAKSARVALQQGANPRRLTVPQQHQLKIAHKTLRMPDAMVGVMGGPTKAQAREIIKRLTGKTIKENPARGAVKIYDQILRIEAKKGNGSMYRGEKFYHNFSPKSKARIYGLADGSILIKGKKKLWDNIRQK